jgi:hypothetical protein
MAELASQKATIKRLKESGASPDIIKTEVGRGSIVPFGSLQEKAFKSLASSGRDG